MHSTLLLFGCKLNKKDITDQLSSSKTLAMNSEGCGSHIIQYRIKFGDRKLLDHLKLSECNLFADLVWMKLERKWMFNSPTYTNT